MSYLLEWWNLIFILPFGFSFLILLLNMTGMFSHGADADVNHDVEIDAHHDFDHNIDHDIDHDINHAGSALGEHSFFYDIFSLIGIGKVPLSLIIMTFGFLWGFLGWASNLLLSSFIKSPSYFIWPSLAIAFTGSFLGTSVISKFIGKLLPSIETYATKSSDLIGKVGKAVLGFTEEGGIVHIKDSRGNLIQVQCKLLDGQKPVEPGKEILIIKYDEEKKVYLGEIWEEKNFIYKN